MQQDFLFVVRQVSDIEDKKIILFIGFVAIRKD